MIKKLHFKIEFLISYIKRKYILFIVGILIGLAFFVTRNYIFSAFSSPQLKTKIIGVEGQYTISSLPESISKSISYGLTITSENDRTSLSPLVKNYDIQNNNQDYIFELNNDFYWHNGKHFTAYDINYQIKGLLITPISNSKIKISTDQPFSPILSVLSKPLFKKNLTGLGEYKLDNLTYQEGYIKTLKLKPKKENTENLLYKFYRNEKELIDAYKLGNVDEIEISQLPPELTNWNKTKISQNIQTNKKYSAIFLNNTKLDNKQIRQALAYATPKTKDKNERCLGPISPNSWAYNTSIKEYNYNPTRAKEIFEKNKIEKINLSVNDRKLLSKAEEIKNAWQSILGLETTITFENQVDFQNYDALLTYGGIPHDPDQYLFWHSTQSKTNITKLNNSRIDKLLEEGRQTIDLQERRKIYFDFQRYLLEESPAIFLTYPTSYVISRI